MSEMTYEEALAHFGVKGMHWGVRKERASLPRAAGYSNNQFQYDKRTYGLTRARAVNAHVLAGETVAKARSLASDEAARHRRNVQLVIAAAAVVALYGPQIRFKANALATSYVNSKQAAAGAKAAANLFADSRGLTNYKTLNVAFDASKNLWG